MNRHMVFQMTQLSLPLMDSTGRDARVQRQAADKGIGITKKQKNGFIGSPIPHHTDPTGITRILGKEDTVSFLTVVWSQNEPNDKTFRFKAKRGN